MSDYRDISTFKDKWISTINWYDSIILEFYLLSGSLFHLTDSGEIGLSQRELGTCGRMLLGLVPQSNGQWEQVDVIFEGITEMRVETTDELAFELTRRERGYALDFSNPEMHSRITRFHATRILVGLTTQRVPAESSFAAQMPLSNCDTAIQIQGNWRQC